MFENENHINAFTQHFDSVKETVGNEMNSKDPKDMSLVEIEQELINMASAIVLEKPVDIDRKNLLLERKAELEN